MRRWIENDAEWYEQTLIHCGCCGRLIAKHLLSTEIDGHAHIFCSHDCADSSKTTCFRSAAVITVRPVTCSSGTSP